MVIALTVAAILAVIDWVGVVRGDQRLRWVGKPGVMIALIVAALLAQGAPSAVKAWFVVALVLSLVGDVALLLPEQWFLAGLVAFLLAHLAYVALFVSNWPRPLRPSAGQVIAAALVVVYGVVMCAWLWTGLGRLRVPALAYAAAIVAMTVSTILAGFSRPYVAIGAVLFLISDSLIAAGRFKLVVPIAGILIWPTYYLAQYAIAIGFLREKTLRG
jgi:uncharacterized membrane protein YhhN